MDGIWFDIDLLRKNLNPLYFWLWSSLIIFRSLFFFQFFFFDKKKTDMMMCLSPLFSSLFFSLSSYVYVSIWMDGCAVYVYIHSIFFIFKPSNWIFLENFHRFLSLSLCSTLPHSSTLFCILFHLIIWIKKNLHLIPLSYRYSLSSSNPRTIHPKFNQPLKISFVFFFILSFILFTERAFT